MEWKKKENNEWQIFINQSNAGKNAHTDHLKTV
jgi:hypothetical protein